ncbi:MAG TPA: tRNA lysidine(34) synthetase TilS [Bacteroidetes bacterium]|nr:tRNA lysidine(34) synthetase TilS [Bacteroidota bacterium]
MKHNQHPLEIAFADFLSSMGLVQHGETVVLALSGGVDSMVMTELFARIRSTWNLSLVIAHVNHQLRGEESLGDEAFVRDQAERWKIPFYAERVDTYGHAASSRLSKQEAARQLRYEVFERVRTKVNASAVATAHQADDNAETVLLNALRGTGVRGLAGIPVRRDPGAIIRPLLFARRSEIALFARENGIQFRDDSSNESNEYRRNYLRHNVIPAIEASKEFDFVTSLNRLSRLMRQLDGLLSAEVRQLMPGMLTRDERGSSSLHISRLRSKPEYLQEGLVLEILKRLGADAEAHKVHQVLELCNRTTGSQVQLSKDLHVYRNRDRLEFVRPRIEPSLHQEVVLGESYALKDFRLTLSEPIPRPASLDSTHSVEFVDARRLGSRLVLRSWQDGDWFMPLGMPFKKKLSDYFVDEKVSLLQKRHIPILESNGEIVWVCGKRLDDRFKVTDETRSVVRLEFGPTIFYH